MSTKYLPNSYDLSDLESMTRDEVDDITVEDWERGDALADMISGIYPAMEVAGTTFDPADIIRLCDPTMWRMMLADEFDEVDLDDYRDE